MDAGADSRDVDPPVAMPTTMPMPTRAAGHDDRVRLHEQVVTQTSEAGLVVLTADSLTYIELDDVGASMWQALASTGSLEASLQLLEQEYEVDPGELAGDLLTFVGRLEEAGLVVDGEVPSAGAGQAQSGPLEVADVAAEAAQELYLDLLMRTICGLTVFGSACHRGRRALGLEEPTEDPAPMSMIGLVRLGNVKDLVERVLAEGVPGDLIECGVWRGGAAMLMKGVLSAHQVFDRQVWLADSFAGLPIPHADLQPTDVRGESWAGQLAVPLEQVERNFEAYGLLDPCVRFLPGWLRDTLPGAPIQQLALIRLDGDLYETTWDALTHLYPRLSAGGYVIVDDYCLDSCRLAVDDYRRAMGIEEELQPIDWNAIWWRKSAGE